MCGLCGFYTNRSAKLSPEQAQIRARIGQALLIANQTRGTDSTGVYLQGNGKYYLYKDIVDAGQFIRQAETKKVFNFDASVMIGHTRWATQGKVTTKNAHPFTKDKIVGAHNGIIKNDFFIRNTHNFKGEVDSEVIFNLLNKYNNDYQKAFKEIEGSAAVAWKHINQPELYLVSHENPISIATVPTLQTSFFTSEYVSLDCILQASIGSENYTIGELEEDMVYTISPDLTLTKTPVKFKKEVFSGIVYPGKDDAQYPTKQLILDPDELEYIKSQCIGNGCDVCNAVLKNFCYYNEEDGTILCAKCVSELDPYDCLHLNLETGIYTFC